MGELDAQNPSNAAPALVVHSAELACAPIWAEVDALPVEFRTSSYDGVAQAMVGAMGGRPTVLVLDVALLDDGGVCGIPPSVARDGPVRVVALCPERARAPSYGLPAEVISCVLPRSASATELARAVTAALREVAVLARMLRLAFEHRRLSREVAELNRIGIALSTERNPQRLLEYILTTTREITCADAGSLYTIEQGEHGERLLRFTLAQNDSLELGTLEQFSFPVSTSTLAGYVAAMGVPLNIRDVYAISPKAPYSFNSSFDQRTGYHTQSMLVVPMRNQADECIGVLQLINRKRYQKAPLSSPRQRIEAFDGQSLELATSLASQAAICLTNTQLYEGLEHKIEELEHAQGQLVQSEKLASLGQLTAGVAHEINNPLAFSRNNTHLARERVASSRRRLAVDAWLRDNPEGEAGGDAGDVLTLLEGDPEFRDDVAEVRADLEGLDPGERGELLRSFMSYVGQSRSATEGSIGELLDSIDGLMLDSLMGLDRVAEIVLGLRNFARLDEAHFQTADIDEGIRQTLMILREPARDANVQIVPELGLPRPIPCFPAKLNQVVLNLVNNAIDACRPGGAVTVRSRETERSVVIEVIDNGHGISEENLSKIFDPFFTTKPVGKGTGLGLSISYRIVQEHHGAISAEPNPAGGTIFRIEIPNNLSEPETEGEGEEDGEGEGGSDPDEPSADA